MSHDISKYTRVSGLGYGFEIHHPESDTARAFGKTQEIAALMMRLLEIQMGLTYLQEGANYDRDAILERLGVLIPDE